MLVLQSYNPTTQMYDKSWNSKLLRIFSYNASQRWELTIRSLPINQLSPDHPLLPNFMQISSHRVGSHAHTSTDHSSRKLLPIESDRHLDVIEPFLFSWERTAKSIQTIQWRIRRERIACRLDTKKISGREAAKLIPNTWYSEYQVNPTFDSFTKYQLSCLSISTWTRTF